MLHCLLLQINQLLANPIPIVPIPQHTPTNSSNYYSTFKSNDKKIAPSWSY